MQTLHVLIAVRGSLKQPFMSPPIQSIRLRVDSAKISWLGEDGLVDHMRNVLQGVDTSKIQFWSEPKEWLQSGENDIYVNEDRVLKFNAMHSMVLPYKAAVCMGITGAVDRQSLRAWLQPRQEPSLRHAGTRTHAPLLTSYINFTFSLMFFSAYTTLPLDYQALPL
jgi:hypothetical protein